jgi:hypothetical protein
MSDLVDACRAWCALTGNEPTKVHGKDTWWITRAVRDCTIDFVQLNDAQRRLIAGWGSDIDATEGRADD